ncbi:hypothetical protein [Levilactobacillus brevis]|uniref:hypothetical protein n=1 Tax=Levilactobacillus brevis TaxID=1580 RepID=UPI0008480E8A|nr:hypothetical protein [Levilactobacillus brevis]ODP93252.1 hypothetical protein BGC39_02080 [Levilactobacillus brevis]ODP93309.1 hypothetical protein BGC39_02395 [Levilactobacillus brevis]
MNPKTQPKVRPKRKFITITIPVNDFIKDEITSLAKITGEQPIIKKVFTDSTNRITDILIQLEGKDYALNDFLVSEKIHTEKNDSAIKEYRYSLTPDQDGKKQYFRFDFQPLKIPVHFPDAHINVNEHTYGKHHLVYPQDTSLDLHKLTMKKAVNVFCHYESTLVHPAINLGKTYISLVNEGENNETIY